MRGNQLLTCGLQEEVGKAHQAAANAQQRAQAADHLAGQRMEVGQCAQCGICYACSWHDAILGIQFVPGCRHGSNPLQHIRAIAF